MVRASTVLPRISRAVQLEDLTLDDLEAVRLLLRGARAFADRDHDGYSARLGGGDCNDRDPEINPGAEEVAGNDVDEDCDGTLNNNCGSITCPADASVPAGNPVALAVTGARSRSSSGVSRSFPWPGHR